jgi:hypothetical protein
MVKPWVVGTAHFSYERRDLAPILETEDFRSEAARRFWDAYSPPDFEFKPGWLDISNMGYPLHSSGSWQAEMRLLYGAGSVATACCASR